jgi:hypothetical protein
MTIDGQTAFAGGYHYQHPTAQDRLNFGEGGALLAGASGGPAGFNGGTLPPLPLALPLPFRPPAPTDVPAVDQHNHHPHLPASCFARPTTLRMAAFSQDDDELARLQELSNKWESDATVSSNPSQLANAPRPAKACGYRTHNPTGSTGQRTARQQRNHHRICQCRPRISGEDCRTCPPAPLRCSCPPQMRASTARLAADS